MPQQPHQCLVPGQGQWYIPRLRLRGDLITFSQPVVVVETQLWIHLYPFGLKVMYNLKQQRSYCYCQQSGEICESFRGLNQLFINIETSQNKLITTSQHLKNIIRLLLLCAAKSLNDISNSLAPISSVKYLCDGGMER